MWEISIKGKVWRVVRSLNVNNRSCIFGGISLLSFPIYQGIAQGSTLSPTWFLIYINRLFSEIKRYLQLGVKFSENKISIYSQAHGTPSVNVCPNLNKTMQAGIVKK